MNKEDKTYKRSVRGRNKGVHLYKAIFEGNY